MSDSERRCWWPWRAGDHVELAFCVLDEGHDGPHADDVLEDESVFYMFGEGVDSMTWELKK